jgi:hypothetical protein
VKRNINRKHHFYFRSKATRFLDKVTNLTVKVHAVIEQFIILTHQLLLIPKMTEMTFSTPLEFFDILYNLVSLQSKAEGSDGMQMLILTCQYCQMFLIVM